jgi:hypothetical protein
VEIAWESTRQDVSNVSNVLASLAAGDDCEELQSFHRMGFTTKHVVSTL